MSEQKTNQQERELSPEEIAQQRANMISFYKDQEDYLNTVLKHEELKAAISKARAERVMYDIRTAQMMAGPPDEDLSEEGNEEQPIPPQEKKSRSLKKNQ